MILRRCAAAALALLTVTALVAGCSSDDDASSDKKKTTTTEKSAGSTTVPTPTTVTDAEFEKAAETSEALVKDAGTDPCKVVSSFSQASNLPTPANATQTERGVKVVAALFEAAAATAPESAQNDAAVLRKAAADLQAEGESKNWDPAWLTTSPGPTAIADPAVSQAFQNYQTAVSKTCGAADGASTTVAP